MYTASLPLSPGLVTRWAPNWVVALADVVAWALLVENCSPVSETIGAGNWLLDLGLWTFAAGCVALRLGMLGLRLGGPAWTVAATQS